MEPTVSSYSHARHPGLVAWCLVLLGSLVLAGASCAATIVVGEVLDQTTGAGVGGAAVSVRRGGGTLGEAVTMPNGRFSVSFDVGSSLDVQSLTLLVEHGDFEGQSLPLTVTAGRPDKPSYRFELFPGALGGCRMQGVHGGVVGYFGSDDLAHNITFALTYSLLQTQKLSRDLLPWFVACNDARPRSPLQWGHYAQALGADVFLSGSVAQRPDRTHYDVHIYVSDRFGLFSPPLHTFHSNVNLQKADAAQLEPITHAAVLVAVANGYEQDGEYAKCVEMTVAAEQLLQGLNDAIRDSRQRCQAHLGNRGLVRGGSP